ncbi:MAG: thioesterase family protein, partial [Actinomycetota bacterium]|nr:thioesterase family protein [Actinomycetota bacterium]
QALSAAFPTVADNYVVSAAHVNFLSGGDSLAPVTFTVQRQRDSRAFANRQVLATQGDRLIAHAGFTFHIPEGGQDMQFPSMPDVPEPSACRAIASLAPGFESRIPDSERDHFYSPCVWARPFHPLGGDPRLNACALLYLSDAHSGIPMLHKLTAEDFHASLDHSIWFHRPANMSDWVFMDKVGESLADGRGWYRGRIFNRQGQLLASLAQEMLLRPASRTDKVVE